MAIKKLTVIDVINAMTPQEKRQVLAVLRKAELTPCEAKGHSFKGYQKQVGWTGIVTEFVCTKCGKRIT